LALAFQVERPDQVELVQVVGAMGLRVGVALAWQPARQAHARERVAIALEGALDGAQALMASDE
jgi:hypothetical protein